ncbi:transcription antitermination protein NusG [Candidatus Magnetobacterium bavaricum]|uniref:Transcription antitermination protein NusG n=1 Tax=Candidatus Magnetobacterium bavaricum TaxID=29290 RepID=A0A0F3GK54_9BACT|nr:transcription antitermination protein NusG [Candidatus Magnetobacterium bavaricum]
MSQIVTVVQDVHWYAVYVKSKHEFKVLEHLEKVGVEVFLATVERLRRWKDRKKIMLFPLFPSYLFVHISNINKELITVLKIPGVVRFLCVIPGEPEPVPDDQINSLKKLITSKESIDPYPYLKEGQRVRVIRGPLAGVEGILIGRYDRHFVVLSIDMLRQGVAVKIDSSDVESI